MRKFYLKLRRKVLNFINAVKSFFFPDKNKKKYLRLNQRDYINIAKSAVFGEFTDFDINGNCRLLEIESGFICRRFCNFLLYPNSSLVIHKNVFFNNYCSINCLGSIEIGENTMFGESVKIYDHNHKYFNDREKLIIEKDKFKIGKVVIGKNCWIGSNVVILNNVEIGDNVIVGANCLIYKSIPSNTIVKNDVSLIVENRNSNS